MANREQSWFFLSLILTVSIHLLVVSPFSRWMDQTLLPFLSDESIEIELTKILPKEIKLVKKKTPPAIPKLKEKLPQNNLFGKLPEKKKELSLTTSKEVSRKPEAVDDYTLVQETVSEKKFELPQLSKVITEDKPEIIEEAKTLEFEEIKTKSKTEILQETKTLEFEEIKTKGKTEILEEVITERKTKVSKEIKAEIFEKMKTSAKTDLFEEAKTDLFEEVKIELFEGVQTELFEEAKTEVREVVKTEVKAEAFEEVIEEETEKLQNRRKEKTTQELIKEKSDQKADVVSPLFLQKDPNRQEYAKPDKEEKTVPDEIKQTFRGSDPEATNDKNLQFSMNTYQWTFERFAENWATDLQKWWKAPLDYVFGKVPEGGDVWMQVKLAKTGNLVGYKIFASNVTTEMELRVIQALIGSLKRPSLPSSFPEELLIINWRFIYPPLRPPLIIRRR